MRREQNIAKAGWTCEDRVELEGNKGVRSIAEPENGEKDGAESLMERMLQRNNLNAAYLRVKRNKGAAGIDAMTVEEMLLYLKEHKDELVRTIRMGTYQPKPVRRVEIDKPDGGKRLLGIPTVIDRMVQQALAQVLQPIFERTFSDNSFGFRPRRSAQQAITRAKEYYEQGNRHVVDIDLAKYFDTVNHDLLVDMVGEQVKEKPVLDLIRRFLKSGVMVEGVVIASEAGTPQGGPLSPLLSNIYLTSFDRELEKRGHRFVRYADDCNIYVKSRRAAERVMANCKKYLEGKLKLKVNTEKSKVGNPTKLKFLGFSLYGSKTGARIRVHEKPMERFKNRIREITSRKRSRPMDETLRELKLYTTGWLNYYGLADMRQRIKSLTEWIRRRIRMCIWKQWKKISARFRNLQQLGVPRQKAWEWSNTSKGYWRIAGSFILTVSLTNKYLATLGYDNISERYEALHSRY
jgi:group II intron reverse transcriptase/maturase